MNKKALGKGVAALFTPEQPSSVIEHPDLEVISNNLEDRASNMGVKNANLERRDKNDISSNLDEITYNLEVMNEALADAKQNPRISLWSPISATILRYLRKTKPEFSISEEAGLLLEDAIMKKYPDLYEIIKNEHESSSKSMGQQ